MWSCFPLANSLLLKRYLLLHQMKVIVKVPWPRPPKEENSGSSELTSTGTNSSSALFSSSSNLLSSQKSVTGNCELLQFVLTSLDASLTTSLTDKPSILKPGWTPEKDQQLWTWLSLYPNPQFINCSLLHYFSTNISGEFIATRLGSTVEECIKRSGELYQQHLQFIQQHFSSPKNSNIFSPSKSRITPSLPRTSSNSILIPTPLRPQARFPCSISFLTGSKPSSVANSTFVSASSINDPNVLSKVTILLAISFSSFKNRF